MSTVVWTNETETRHFMQALLPRAQVSEQKLPDVGELEKSADFLIYQGIAPVIYERLRDNHPLLAKPFQMDAFTASIENDLYFTSLKRMLAAANEADIPVILLKGIALAADVYEKRSLRTMTDIDVLIKYEDMSKFTRIMLENDFSVQGKLGKKLDEVGLPADDEPPLLTSRGKSKFKLRGFAIGGIETHVTPFAGEFLESTTSPVVAELWERAEQTKIDDCVAWQLAPEDMVLHTATHLAISNQFGINAIRGLLDIMHVATVQGINWTTLVDRAIAWDMKTSMWLTLHIADQLFNIPDARADIARIAPSKSKQLMLSRLVNCETVLTGKSLVGGKQRYLYLLNMVDKPSRIPKLVWSLK